MGSIGKFVAGRRYFHTSAVSSLEPPAVELLSAASGLASIKPNRDYNVARIDPSNNTISLLSYPGFFDEAFPRLARSWRVSLVQRQVTLRNYEDSLNPPVLHRKELLLNADDPRRSAYERLTTQIESQRLFEDPVRIGFKLQWERLLTERGFRVVDHQLVPIGNEERFDDAAIDASGPIAVARHLTALSRQNFSAPIQILQRFGFLDGVRTVFDYGCGKGDDVRGLVTDGMSAAGWDPHYAPSNPISSAHIVNLGFVINVIEDPVERREALQRAHSLAKELLVVSTMLATENPGKVTVYGDGFLTSRTTFQKYYTQGELRDYIASTLGEDPIPVAPGVFFVFSDRDAEQRFQVGRYRSRIRIHPLVRPERPQVIPRPKRIREPTPDPYELHREMLDLLWARCLELGREPEPFEISSLEAIEGTLGSLRKALKLVFARNDLSLLERARHQRVDDLKVFLALQQFQKRKPYRQLEGGLQRDIRAFFGDYTSAQEHSRHLLSKVAQPEVLDEACRTAAERGLGWLEAGHSLQLHSSLVPRLPAPLRVYIGCAAVLYGDPSEADLVKIHIRSGKVSFMKYDNFFESALPRMTERTKINLRTLDLQLFAYGAAYPCPLLYSKSRYINEELPHYAEQLAFEQELQALNLVDLSGFGPSEEELNQALRQACWSVDGFSLRRLHAVPNLDDRCGRYLTYRQLIECGETQFSSGLPNLPKNPESYTAVQDLAVNILDPVIEYFGGIDLTYGFCCAELANRIPGRIAPELDQHAAHETKRNGNPICARLGAAVDFFVRDENMQEVADWVIANLPFDRLYFYGKERPIHVSYGPEDKREAVEMVPTHQGRLMPRPYRPPTS
jgi:DNA phosphorothioation-associated putative methyltransferase